MTKQSADGYRVSNLDDHPELVPLRQAHVNEYKALRQRHRLTEDTAGVKCRLSVRNGVFCASGVIECHNVAARDSVRWMLKLDVSLTTIYTR